MGRAQREQRRALCLSHSTESSDVEPLEAGPVEGRYWANVISAALSLLTALAATPVALLLGVLPSAFIVALAGLAILPSLQNALEKAFEAKLRFGAVVATRGLNRMIDDNHHDTLHRGRDTRTIQ